MVGSWDGTGVCAEELEGAVVGVGLRPDSAEAAEIICIVNMQTTNSKTRTETKAKRLTICYPMYSAAGLENKRLLVNISGLSGGCLVYVS